MLKIFSIYSEKNLRWKKGTKMFLVLYREENE